jgi:hypothetical protein
MENLYQFHTRALCLHLVKGGTDFLSLWLGLGPLSTETDKSAIVIYWLVVSTPLKNISQQLGLFFPIYRKIKNVPNHQPVYKFICVEHLQRSGRASLVTRTGSPEQGVSGVSAQTLRQFLRKPSVLQLYRFYSFDTHKLPTKLHHRRPQTVSGFKKCFEEQEQGQKHDKTLYKNP